jgi:hypothetical protein
VNPNSNPGLVGKTVFVTLFNGRRVEGRVTAMLNTVAAVNIGATVLSFGEISTEDTPEDMWMAKPRPNFD